MTQYTLKNIDRLCDAVKDSGIHVFIINGAPRSGKDTLVDMFEEYLNMRLDNFSTVDFVKDIAARYGGWDGRKTPKDRKFLSDLKDLFTEWNDIPFADVVERIVQRIDEYESFGLDLQSRIVFIHCREPQEIQKFKDRLGAKTILMRRDEAENQEQSNHADAQVLDYEYDYTFENNGTIADLLQKVSEFCDNYPQLKIYF